MRQRTGARWGASTLGLVIVLGMSTPALAADATGTWKWKVERDGNVFEPVLKLKQEKEKLTGTITGRQGSEIDIEDGKVSSETVSFKVVREFNGNKIVFLYEGKLSDDAIKGEVKIDRNGETETREWEAKREK